MANVAVTSDAWTEISITSGTIQNISATADIELSAEQTDNSGVVLKPSEIYQWDNETIYARAVTENTGALRVVNFKRATGGGYVLPVATASTLGGVKVGGGLDIDANGVLSAPVSYSTTEQQIGTWIDGKPLYQITIVDTMPTVLTPGVRETKYIDVSSLHIKVGVDLCGFVYENGDSPLTFYASINSTNRTADDLFRFCSFHSNVTPLDSLFLCSSVIADSEMPVYITIRYTKTTD